MMKRIIYLLFAIVLLACQPKPNPMDTDYLEMHKHTGSKNYNIDVLYEKDYEIFAPDFDKDENVLIAYGKTNPIKNTEKI